jgi:hypothetical protein
MASSHIQNCAYSISVVPTSFRPSFRPQWWNPPKIMSRLSLLGLLLMRYACMLLNGCPVFVPDRFLLILQCEARRIHISSITTFPYSDIQFLCYLTLLCYLSFWVKFVFCGRLTSFSEWLNNDLVTFSSKDIKFALSQKICSWARLSWFNWLSMNSEDFKNC